MDRTIYYKIGPFGEGELSKILEALEDSVELQSNPKLALKVDVLIDRIEDAEEVKTAQEYASFLRKTITNPWLQFLIPLFQMLKFFEKNRYYGLKNYRLEQKNE